jgi:hypothetical protein
MVRICLTTGLLLILGIRGSFAAGELYLIISPSATTLTAKGFVDFDAYIYNSSDRRIQVPAPQEGSTSFGHCMTFAKSVPIEMDLTLF